MLLRSQTQRIILGNLPMNSIKLKGKALYPALSTSGLDLAVFKWGTVQNSNSVRKKKNKQTETDDKSFVQTQSQTDLYCCWNNSEGQFLECLQNHL